MWSNGLFGVHIPMESESPIIPGEADKELVLVSKGIVMNSSRKVFEIIQKEKEGFEFVQSNS